MTSAPRPVRVLLVHGTQFRGEEDDLDVVGQPEDTSGWWTAGSEFRRELKEAVRRAEGASARVVAWKWSGANSERARRRAGKRLLRQLLRYERRGDPYHVIAHSHGGSVLWHALTDAPHAMPKMRSWTTVGTPFLRFGIRAMAWIYLALIIGGIAAVSSNLYGCRTALREASATYSEGLLDTWHNLVAGEEGALPAFMLATGVLVVVLVLGWRIAQMGTAPIVRGALEMRRKMHAKTARRRFRSRWLGLHSTGDEAIAGLRSTLVTPRMRIFRIPFIRSSNRALQLMGEVVNAPAAPFDYAVMRRLVDRGHGADIAGLRLVDVSASPPPQPPPRPLGRRTEEAIRLEARTSAERLLDRLRETLYRGSVRPRPTTLHRVLGTIKELRLVHTSYFDTSTVRRVLTRRVAAAEPRPPRPMAPRRVRPHLFRTSAAVQEFALHGIALNALGFMLVGAFIASQVTSNPFSAAGMASHATENRPALDQLLTSQAAFASDDDQALPLRRTCAGWLQTLAKLDRVAVALADARRLESPSHRAWVASLLHRYSSDPGDRELCLEVLEESFALVQPSDDQPDQVGTMDFGAAGRVLSRAFLAQIEADEEELADAAAASEANDGGDAHGEPSDAVAGGPDTGADATPTDASLRRALVDQLLQPDLVWTEDVALTALEHVNDDDMWRFLQGYAALLSNRDAGSAARPPTADEWIDRLAELGEHGSLHGPLERVIAYYYGHTGQVPELATLLETSFVDTEGEVGLDPNLIAGLRGMLHGNQDRQRMFDSLLAVRIAPGSSTAVIRALEIASAALYLDQAEGAGVDAALPRRMADYAHDLLHPNAPSGMPQWPAEVSTALLARAHLTTGWAYLELLRRSFDEVGRGGSRALLRDRMRHNLQAAADQAIHREGSRDPVLAKAATLLASGGALHREQAIRIASGIADDDRRERKLEDIDTIAQLCQSSGQPPADDALLEHRAGSFLDETNVSLPRVEFATKLARRILTAQTRSALLLRAARWFESERLRPRAYRLLVECEPEHQAEFWCSKLRPVLDG